jgi:integrase/recombinase XerD
VLFVVVFPGPVARDRGLQRNRVPIARCRDRRPDHRDHRDERIRQILSAAAETAGLKRKLWPHWLRHAHGSHAHQRGAPVATIRDILGHASLSTTDVYLSSAPTDGSSLY